LFTAIGCTIALSALALSPGVFFFYDVTPKIVVLLLGCAVVVAGGPQWIPGLRGLRAHFAGQVLLAALALQAVSAVLSTLLSADRGLSFIGSSWRRLGLLEELALLVLAAALACLVAGSQHRVLLLLRAIGLAGAIGALYGVAQYFGLDPFLAAESYQVGEGEWMIVRTPGTLGHAGYFAIFLMHGFFAGAALARLEPSTRWRRIGATAATLTAAAVVLSGTRSAILGLGAGAGFLLIWFRPRFRRRNLLAVVLLVCAAWGFYSSPAGQQLRARTRWYVEDPAGGGRLILWRDSARMGAARWHSGWGLETFSAAFLAYQSVELAQAFPERYYESAHNVLLDAWTGQGLPGVIALAGVLLGGGVSLWSARHPGSRLAGFLGAGLIAAAVGGQFLAFTAVTKLYFYAQASLLVALAAPAVSHSRMASAGWPMRLACLAAACLPAYFAMSLARADWRLEGVRQAVQSDDPRRAIDQYRLFIAAKPEGFYMDLWFSRELAAAAERASNESIRRELWSAGKEAAVRAAAASETPQNASYNLAFFASQEGDLAGVEQHLRAAIAAAPNWFQPYWMLAQVLAASGRPAEAAPLADRAVQLSGGANAEVNAVQQSLRQATRP
jgi:O-antigen ligase